MTDLKDDYTTIKAKADTDARILEVRAKSLWSRYEVYLIGAAGVMLGFLLGRL